MHSATTNSIDDPPPLELSFDVKSVGVTKEPEPRLEEVVDKVNIPNVGDSRVEYPSMLGYSSPALSELGHLQNVTLGDRALILILEGDPDPFDYICSKIKAFPTLDQSNHNSFISYAQNL